MALRSSHSPVARRLGRWVLPLAVCVGVALMIGAAACSDEKPASTSTPAATPVDYSPGRLACVQLRITSDRVARQGVAGLPQDEYERVLERIAADYATAATLAEEAEPEIRDAIARLAQVFEALDQVGPDEILKAPALARDACKNAGYL